MPVGVVSSVDADEDKRSGEREEESHGYDAHVAARRRVDEVGGITRRGFHCRRQLRIGG